MEFEACAEAVKDTSDHQLMEAARKSTHMLKTAWEKVRDDGTIKELTNIGHLDELSETPCLIVLLSTLTSLAAKELVARGFKQDKEGSLWKGNMPEEMEPVKEEKTEVTQEIEVEEVDLDLIDNEMLTATILYAGRKMKEYYAIAKDVDKRGDGHPSDEYTMAVTLSILIHFCNRELNERKKKEK